MEKSTTSSHQHPSDSTTNLFRQTVNRDGSPWATDRKINDKPRYVTFTYPGMPFWSQDVYTESPSLMSVVGACEDCWCYGFLQHASESDNNSLILHMEMLQSGVLYFHIEHEFHMSRALYNKSLLKCPLKAKYGYGYRSGSFVTTYLELRANAVNDPLVKMKMSCVYLDRATRKPAKSLPRWYTDALEGKEMLEEGLRLERLKPRPRETYRHKSKILITDIDYNKHANFKAYIRKCHDALSYALTNKEKMEAEKNSEHDSNVNSSGHKQFYPKWLTSDMFKEGIATLRYKFVKETILGDEISIYLWQEEDKPFWVFFSLEKEQPLKNTIHFEMSMEFFKPLPKL